MEKDLMAELKVEEVYGLANCMWVWKLGLL